MNRLESSTRRRLCAGFTMVEMLVVILILGLVTGIIAEAFIMTTRTTVSMNKRSAVAFSLQEGAEKMVDQLRRASAIIDAAPDTIEFTLGNNYLGTSEDVIFAYDAANKAITRNGSLFASDVTNLALTYYDLAGAQTDIIGDIKSIRIVIDGNAGNEPWKLDTQVSCRKLHPGSVL